MESNDDELGYYDSGEFESGDYDWSLEEEPIIQVRRFESDVFSGVLTKDLPALLLNMDLNSLQHFCSTNIRINHLCQSNQFWYLKLQYDYPGYILYYKKSKTYLGNLIYQDMLGNSQAYYIIYNHFRYCMDTTTNEDEIIVHKEKWQLANIFQTIRNIRLADSTLKKLLSLTLPYTGKLFEEEMVNKGFQLLSTDTLIYSMIPHYFNQYGQFSRYLSEFKKENYDRWKILKCVSQLYYKLTYIMY